MTIRVVIADDQQLVRAGLRKILEAEDDIAVLAGASNGLEAITAARRPDQGATPPAPAISAADGVARSSDFRPASAIAASSWGSTPATPIAPAHWPSTMMGIPPSRG